MPLAARSTCDLGLVGYGEGLRIQQEYAERRRAGEIPDTLLLCEHPATYTLGTTAKDGDVLDRTRAPVVRTDRGGEATWHGPGQVVGYVIADLNARGRDLHAHCRMLEEIMFRALADFGIEGARVAGLTGAWIDSAPESAERPPADSSRRGSKGAKADQPQKIGAVGVRVRRWISTHGFALNVNCDLSYFSGIIPCGIADRGVTSMAQVLDRTIDIQAVKESCAGAFEEVFRSVA